MSLWVLHRPLVVAVLIVLVAGCGPREFNDPDRFEDFVSDVDGPFVRTSEHDHVTVRARFAPPEVMALPDVRYARERRSALRTNDRVSDSTRAARRAEIEEELRSQRATYEASLYFYLTIEPTEGDLVYRTLQQKGYGAYQQWLRRLLFGLQSKIRLQTDAIDEIPLSIYRMERSFGMSTSRTFLLAFPATFDGTDLRTQSVDLVVSEFGLRTGAITFTFDAAHLWTAARLTPRA